MKEILSHGIAGDGAGAIIVSQLKANQGILGSKTVHFTLKLPRMFKAICDRTFQEKPRFVCECLIPGNQLKCQSCSQFKEFLGLVKQKMGELRFLSF